MLNAGVISSFPTEWTHYRFLDIYNLENQQKKIVIVNNTTLHGQFLPSSKCDRDSESNPTKLFFDLRQIQTDKECTDICCHTILNFSVLLILGKWGGNLYSKQNIRFS